MISANAAPQPVAACTLRHGINLPFEFKPALGEHITDTKSRWPYLREPVHSIGRLKEVSGEGFDFVRVLIDAIPLLSQPIDESLVTWLGDFVQQARSLNLCVVLTPNLPNAKSPLHAAAVFGNAETAANYRRMLVRLGQLGAAHPGAVLEFLNEPPGGCKNDEGIEWEAIQPPLYQAVREVAPSLPILITGECWSSLDGLVKFDPSPFLHDPQVFFTIHFYEPHQFAEQGAEFKRCPFPELSEIPYPTNASCQSAALAATRAALAKDAPGGDEKCERQATSMIEGYCRRLGTPAYISQRMETARRWADAHGIAPNHVVVAEFGADSKAGWPDRIRYLGDVRQAIEAQGFGWAVWGLGGEFSTECPNGPKDAVCPPIRRALGLSS